MELSGLQGGQEYRDLDTGRGATQRRYILRRDRSWQTAGERARQEARSVAQVYELDPAHRDPRVIGRDVPHSQRSEEHTFELQSLMRLSYDVYSWKTKITIYSHTQIMTNAVYHH